MIGASPFAFTSPSATRDFSAGPGLSSVQSALSPVNLEPERGKFNIQNTAGLIDFLMVDPNPEGEGTTGEGRTTDQFETAPEAPLTFNQQLTGALIIGALVLGVLFLVK